MSQFLEAYRARWRLQTSGTDLPFGLERPALFSAAAAAQEPMNGSGLWRRWAQTMLPWQYGDWVEEALAVHRTAFIGDWSALSKISITGRDAGAFLGRVGVADLSKFSVGRIRHFVCVNEQGKVATEGVLGRLGEESYFYTGGGGEWLIHQFGQNVWDGAISLVSPDYFMFEIQGPQSFRIIETCCQSSIEGLTFNRWVDNRIGDVDLRILRTGVSGELGYEIHGPSEHAAQVWRTVMEHGAEHGLRPLGNRSQVLAHVEAGIATVGFDYMPSTLSAPIKAATSVSGSGQRIGGTFEIGSVQDLYRSPFELNWCSANVVRRCDFLGGDALRAELDTGGPQRKLVGLVWNTDDVLGIYRTLFEDGAIAAQMDLPRHYAAEYFSVLVKSELRGVATSRVYSPQLRRMISLGVMDVDAMRAQTSCTVVWGDRGGPSTEIRAEIVGLPFKPDRRREAVQT